MKNTKTVLDRAEYIIENNACYMNPGPTARKSVKEIDERYILIQRNALPTVEKVDSPHYIRSYSAQVGGVTDQNSDPEFHRKRATEHLAMATYLTNKVAEDAAKLLADRKKVWKELFPEGSTDDGIWSWDNQFDHVKTAINKILSLQSSLHGAHF